MDRNVVTEADAAARRTTLGGGKNLRGIKQLDSDHYIGRLVKYVPAEAIAVYIALQAQFEQLTKEQHQVAVAWGAFAVIALFMPRYLKKLADVSRVEQILISELAFLGWAASLKGLPFQLEPAALRTIVVMVATFALPGIKLEVLLSLKKQLFGSKSPPGTEADKQTGDARRRNDDKEQ